MNSVVGIFTSRMDAESAIDKLQFAGFQEEALLLLTPEFTVEQARSVPTEDAESPGIGKTIGVIVGGAAGLASGVIASSVLLPGVGPILAVGLGASAFGLGGALVGGSAGGLLERLLSQGLPKDELFFYEDALKQGRSLVVGFSGDDHVISRGRKIINDSGAESIDAAREKWWIGLRDAEEVEYSAPHRNFKNSEGLYQLGFETALYPEARGKSLQQAKNLVDRHDPSLWEEEAFREGYERGQKYYRQWRAQKKGAEGEIEQRL